MRPCRWSWPLGAVLGSIWLAAALADTGPAVPVRVGNHEGYSRVVFNLPSRADYQITQQGDHVVVHFPADVSIGVANAMPRNVLAITGGAGQAELVLAPGATFRDWRLGNVVVIDVADHDTSGGKPTTQQTGTTQPPPTGAHASATACNPSRWTISGRTVAGGKGRATTGPAEIGGRQPPPGHGPGSRAAAATDGATGPAEIGGWQPPPGHGPGSRAAATTDGATGAAEICGWQPPPGHGPGSRATATTDDATGAAGGLG